MPGKRPSFQFYPGDWLRDPAVRSVSYAARGLWTDMLCLMFQCDRKGYLQLNGKPVTAAQLARMTGGATDEVSRLLQELETSGVFSSTEHGIIYSRRMVRDERKRELCSEAGKRGGGNPQMQEWAGLPGFVYAMRRERDGAVKLGASVNPKHRKNRSCGSLRGEDLTIVQTWAVTVMGDAEAALHELFAAKGLGGEWFKLDDADVAAIGPHLAFKGLLKGGPKVGPKRRPNPSSSASSSRESTNVDSPPLPPNLDTADFREAWKRWVAYRKEKRKPLTPLSVEEQLADMSRWGAAQAIQAIRNAIRNGWVGVFEPSGSSRNGATNSAAQQTAQNLLGFGEEEPHEP